MADGEQAGRGDDSPTEVQLQDLWQRTLTREDGDDGRSSAVGLFDGLPQPPEGWRNKSGYLDFALRPAEADYLRTRWKGAGRPGPPLLSKLVENGVAADSLWSSAVRSVADDSERAALVLAEEAAALACIARAVHSVLIETRRNEERDLSDQRHQDALPDLVYEHRDAALRLDVDALKSATGIDRDLGDFMIAIQGWIRDGRPAEAIAKVVARREHALKSGRAYLVREKRRADWRKAVATPLDYRWPMVRAMINRVLEAA